MENQEINFEEAYKKIKDQIYETTGLKFLDFDYKLSKKPLSGKSIIYEIKMGKYIYFGSTDKSFNARFGTHRSDAFNLKNTWKMVCVLRKHFDIVKAKIILEISDEERFFCEKKCIDALFDNLPKEYILNTNRDPTQSPMKDPEIVKKQTESRKQGAGWKGWNKGIPMSQEAKEKSSASKKGKKLSEDHKEKMRKGRKQKYYPLSEEGRNIIIEAARKKSKKVQNINTGIIYNSAKEASKETQISAEVIRKHCRNDVLKIRWRYV